MTDSSGSLRQDIQMAVFGNVVAAEAIFVDDSDSAYHGQMDPNGQMLRHMLCFGVKTTR